MQTRDFERKIRKLNPKLHVWYGNDDSKHASVWYDSPTLNGSEPYELAGIPKVEVPEWSVLNSKGKMVIGGWNRVLKMLVSKQLIQRHASYRYFGHWDSHQSPSYVTDRTPVDSAIAEMESTRHRMVEIDNPLNEGERIWTKVYNPDDVVNIGKMVKENKQC